MTRFEVFNVNKNVKAVANLPVHSSRLSLYPTSSIPLPKCLLHSHSHLATFTSPYHSPPTPPFFSHTPLNIDCTYVLVSLTSRQPLPFPKLSFPPSPGPLPSPLFHLSPRPLPPPSSPLLSLFALFPLTSPFRKSKEPL